MSAQHNPDTVHLKFLNNASAWHQAYVCTGIKYCKAIHPDLHPHHIQTAPSNDLIKCSANFINSTLWQQLQAQACNHVIPPTQNETHERIAK